MQKKPKKKTRKNSEDSDSQEEWNHNEVIAMVQKTAKKRKQTIMEAALRIKRKETRK